MSSTNPSDGDVPPADAGRFDVATWIASRGIRVWRGAACLPPDVDIAHPGFTSTLRRDWCSCDRTLRLPEIELLVCSSYEKVFARSALYRVEGDALVLVPPVLFTLGYWRGATRPGPEPAPPSLEDAYWIDMETAYELDVDGGAIILRNRHSDFYSCETNAPKLRDAWKVAFAPSFARERADFILATKAAKQLCDSRGRYYYRDGKLERDASTAPPPL